jgi:hypothetical protein
MPWWEITLIAVVSVGYGPMTFITSHLYATRVKEMYGEDLPFLMLAGLLWPASLPALGAWRSLAVIFNKWYDHLRKANVK